nr:MAG TPA: hypothetical protein [Caudoviricetes sp.]
MTDSSHSVLSSPIGRMLKPGTSTGISGTNPA